MHGVLVDDSTTRPLFLFDYMINTKEGTCRSHPPAPCELRCPFLFSATTRPTRPEILKDMSPLRDVQAAMELSHRNGWMIAKITADLGEQALWIKAFQEGELRTKVRHVKTLTP